jgi:HEPN domain-containing protein
MQMNGNDIDHGVDYIKKEIADVMQEEVEEPEVKVETGPVITIQDRIREKVSECVGELEGQIDELVTTAFKANVSPYAIMHTLDIKGIHANRVIDAFKSKRQEFDEVMNTDDKEVKEGYSNFKKTELKKLVAYCDQVIMDGLKITGAATKSRKPRKRKEKTPDQLVEKMKLCVEFAELNIKSVKPREIVGAMALWVYNTKTRKLGCYHAEDAAGFSVKGTSLTNFNETKSVQKKLRKPEVTLPEVLNGGKVYLRSAMDNIRAVESALTGRINEDTILVRAITK